MPRIAYSVGTGFEIVGLDDDAARGNLARLSTVIAQGSATELQHAGGERACDRFAHATEEEDTLAWVARHFARRVSQYGVSTQVEAAFAKGNSGPGALRLTQQNAKRAEAVLCDAIDRGDGQSMLRGAALVVQMWGAHHRELPRLRALTWATRVLGERCIKGDFATTSSQAPLTTELAQESARRYLNGMTQHD